MQAVLNLLDTRYYLQLSVVELASAINLSVSRLQHIFRDQTGTSISAYLRGRRLQEACVLLVETSLRVSEVAYRVGFDTLSGFDHAFRTEFHMSPTEFRVAESVRDMRTKHIVVIQPTNSTECE